MYEDDGPKANAKLHFLLRIARLLGLFTGYRGPRVGIVMQPKFD